MAESRVFQKTNGVTIDGMGEVYRISCVRQKVL